MTTPAETSKPGWKTTEAGFSGGALAFLAYLAVDALNRENSIVCVTCVAGIVALSVAYARLRTEAKTE